MQRLFSYLGHIIERVVVVTAMMMMMMMMMAVWLGLVWPLRLLIQVPTVYTLPSSWFVNLA